MESNSKAKPPKPRNSVSATQHCQRFETEPQSPTGWRISQEFTRALNDMNFMKMINPEQVPSGSWFLQGEEFKTLSPLIIGWKFKPFHQSLQAYTVWNIGQQVWELVWTHCSKGRQTKIHLKMGLGLWCKVREWGLRHTAFCWLHIFDWNKASTLHWHRCQWSRGNNFGRYIISDQNTNSHILEYYVSYIKEQPAALKFQDKLIFQLL